MTGILSQEEINALLNSPPTESNTNEEKGKEESPNIVSLIPSEKPKILVYYKFLKSGDKFEYSLNLYIKLDKDYARSNEKIPEKFEKDIEVLVLDSDYKEYMEKVPIKNKDSKYQDFYDRIIKLEKDTRRIIKLLNKVDERSSSLITFDNH